MITPEEQAEFDELEAQLWELVDNCHDQEKVAVQLAVISLEKVMELFGVALVELSVGQSRIVYLEGALIGAGLTSAQVEDILEKGPGRRQTAVHKQPITSRRHDAEPAPDPGTEVDKETGRRIHARDKCAGEHCAFHNPSDHKMVSWKKVIRESTLVERICPHGIGHPDPDSLAYLKRSESEENRGALGVHGCDGCCAKSDRK